MNAVDRAPIFCRFHGSDQCRGNLHLDEHRLESGGWRHPDGLDRNGYYAFGAEAVQ